MRVGAWWVIESVFLRSPDKGFWASTPRHAQMAGDLGFAVQFNAETLWHFAQLRYSRIFCTSCLRGVLAITPVPPSSKKCKIYENEYGYTGYNIHGQNVSVLSTKREICQAALQFVPTDIECNVVKYPVNVQADGNWLPQCGSVFAFGTEHSAVEVCAPISVELAIHKDTYLDP